MHAQVGGAPKLSQMRKPLYMSKEGSDHRAKAGSDLKSYSRRQSSPSKVSISVTLSISLSAQKTCVVEDLEDTKQIKDVPGDPYMVADNFSNALRLKDV